MEYNDTAVFDFSPQQVFDVVADIENYPRFLPGWISARIIDKQQNKMTVEQELGFTFLHWRFTSQAIFEPPLHLHISSHKGHFFHLEIDWSFSAVEDNKTRVSLVAKADSPPGPQQRFLQGMLSGTTRSLLNCFEERIKNVYSAND